MNNTIQYKADAVCSNCGTFGAYDLGDQYLCSECYGERGSCCMEFGGNDMWNEECSPKEKNS